LARRQHRERCDSNHRLTTEITPSRQHVTNDCLIFDGDKL